MTAINKPRYRIYFGHNKSLHVYLIEKNLSMWYYGWFENYNG